MHILFVHQNFPAQFGHIAEYLARRHGHRRMAAALEPSQGAKGRARPVRQSEAGPR